MSFVESPRSTCALGGALTYVNSLSRTAPIIHAGPGCGSVLTFGQNFGGGYQHIGYSGGFAAPSSNTLERHVVFGGEDRLREQITTTLEVIDADLYVVITGCTAGLIGDDVRAVVGEFAEKGKNVVFAETPGFKGNTYTGYEIATRALLSQVVRPSAKKSQRTVNLLGIVPAQDPFWQGNLAEIRRLLEKIGVKVNLSGDGDRLAGVRRAAEVALNIVLSPTTGLAAARYLWEAHGVPYIQLPLPVGVDTGSFLRNVAEVFRLEEAKVESVIAEEEEFLWKHLVKLSEAYAYILVNREFGIVSDSNYAIGLTRFLTNDLGLIPRIVILTDDPPEPLHDSIHAGFAGLEGGIAPKVVFEPDGFNIACLIEDNRPDILLGSTLDREVAKKLLVPILPLSFPLTDRVALSNGYAGYRGAVNLAEDLGSAILST
jgi:nitrogenase molybdenum-iron protein beta chain